MSWITTLIRKKLESALVEEENTDYEIELFSKDKKYRAVFEGKLQIRRVEK